MKKSVDILWILHSLLVYYCHQLLNLESLIIILESLNCVSHQFSHLLHS